MPMKTDVLDGGGHTMPVIPTLKRLRQEQNDFEFE